MTELGVVSPLKTVTFKPELNLSMPNYFGCAIKVNRNLFEGAGKLSFMSVDDEKENPGGRSGIFFLIGWFPLLNGNLACRFGFYLFAFGKGKVQYAVFVPCMDIVSIYNVLRN